VLAADTHAEDETARSERDQGRDLAGHSHGVPQWKQVDGGLDFKRAGHSRNRGRADHSVETLSTAEQDVVTNANAIDPGSFSGRDECAQCAGIGHEEVVR
jgi:hypothetical protein